jgi:hypothetical protein
MNEKSIKCPYCKKWFDLDDLDFETKNPSSGYVEFRVKFNPDKNDWDIVDDNDDSIE